MDRGFNIVRKFAPAGVMETPPAPAHIVSLHVGAPIIVHCVCGGRTRSGPLAPGDLQIIPYGVSGRWIDEADAEYLRIAVEPYYLNSVAAGLGIDPSRVELIPELHARDSEIEHIGRALECAFAGANGHASLVVDSLGLALCGRLIERFADVRIVQPRGRLSNRQLNAVIDYVEANLASPLTLKALAEVAGVSVSHFKMLFKNAKGVPAHAYVVRRRVERAAQMIKESDTPLSQIALEAGFSHQSHLARSMRKTLGLTPGKLARTLRL